MDGVWGCDDRIGGLIAFIESDMLVIDVDRRATSDSVHRFSAKEHSDIRYFVTGDTEEMSSQQNRQTQPSPPT